MSTAKTSYIERILNKPASNITSKKQHFSKRIILSAQSEYFPVVCDFTGSVSALHIPAIPGKALSYISPLAILSNARGLAQEGADYLNKLEVQTLAAILITLADEYELFRYAPSDSGAQKNAILRTISKITLVDAIIFIENHIHSANCTFLPSLSLIASADIAQNGIQARMNEWLKLCAERLIERVEAEEDNSAEYHKTARIKPVTNSKARKAAIAKRKEYREFKKESKADISSLFTANLISAKLRDYLSSILSGDLLENASSEIITLICTKLRGINDNRALKLADKITHFYVELSDIKDAENEFDDLAPNFSSKPVGVYASDSEDNEFESPAEGSASLSIESTQPTVQAMASVAEKPKSFLEKLKARKLAEASKSASIVFKEPEQDAPF